MFRQAIAVIGILSVAINISLAAIEIGAFNTQIYGKTKASKPEIVEMFLEVTILYVAMSYVVAVNVSYNCRLLNSSVAFGAIRHARY